MACVIGYSKVLLKKFEVTEDLIVCYNTIYYNAKQLTSYILNIPIISFKVDA